LIPTGSVSSEPCAWPAAPPPAQQTFPPQDWTKALPTIHAEITRKINPVRRHHTFPRAVKRARHNSYRVKKPGKTGTRHPGPATIRLHTITPRAV
jgi:hypothetical protein